MERYQRLIELIKIANLSNSLRKQLEALRAPIMVAAQEIYDSWMQDDEGFDEEFGSGGICDEIAQKMSEIIASNVSDARIREGGQEGDDHAYLIVYNNHEAYEVDIPPGVYETGSGYSWKKREGVQFKLSDIIIAPLPKSWLKDIIDNEDDEY